MSGQSFSIYRKKKAGFDAVGEDVTQRQPMEVWKALNSLDISADFTVKDALTPIKGRLCKQMDNEKYFDENSVKFIKLGDVTL